MKQEKKLPKTITLSADRYEYLQKRDDILSALEAGGVDNWDWYYESLKEAGLVGNEDDE